MATGCRGSDECCIDETIQVEAQGNMRELRGRAPLILSHGDIVESTVLLFLSAQL